MRPDINCSTIKIVEQFILLAVAGQSATPDSEKNAKKSGKRGGNQEKSGKRGEIGKKMQKLGKFFHFAPPDR